MGVVSKRSAMTFFSDPRAHYSHRVRIVLAEKGVTVDVVDVDPTQPPEEVLELNPYGTLPTLLDRELVLYESKVMMEYLDERFPHPPLLPVYPVTRAQCRQIMWRIERDWSLLVDTIVYGKQKDQVARARKDLKDGLVAIAPIFDEKPFFLSDEFSLVDCCMAPILWRLDDLEIKLPNTRGVKPLLGYMERLFKRDAFKLSLSEFEREMRS